MVGVLTHHYLSCVPQSNHTFRTLLSKQITMSNPINVIVRFELKEGEIDKLVPLVQEFFTKEVSSAPGFISAKLHRNEEGTVFINYTTWESPEHYQKFIKEIAMGSEISKQIRAFSSKADWVFEIPL